MVTDSEGLKSLYEDTFLHRLRQRKIKKRYSELYELQQGLLQMRLLLTKDEKTPDWTEKQVEDAIRSLKNGKSRDPLGHVNELYKVCGKDMIRSLTKMFNKIKAL